MPAHLLMKVTSIEGEVESKIALHNARLVPHIEDGNQTIKTVSKV